MSNPRGPWCSCGHEFRSRDGVAEDLAFVSQWGCAYCGSVSPPLPRKPFIELSKSQIEKFLLCNARWYFQYVMHRREPTGKYAKFGIVFHGFAEAYLKTGALPAVNSLLPKSDETRAALSLLGEIPHLPPPTTPGLDVEGEFHYEFEGVRYAGFKDFWMPLGAFQSTAPARMRFDGYDTCVGDHKTTGDFKRAPTVNELINGMERVLYAWDDIRRGANGVWLSWIYALRGERAALPVHGYLSRNVAYEKMREINETSKKIIRLLQAPPDVRTMETNGSACRAYGETCPHLSYCHVTNEQRLGGLDMSIPGQPPATVNGLDALMAMAAPQAPAPVAPAQWAPPPAVAPVAQAPQWAASPPPAQWQQTALQVPPPAPAPQWAPPPAPAPVAQAPAPQWAPPPAPAPVAQAPAPQYAPPPAPPAPPAPAPQSINPPPAPLPEISPNGRYALEFQGKRHEVLGAQVHAAMQAGATFLGVLEAPPPTPAAPAAPRAPGAKRGRPKKSDTVPGSATENDGDKFHALLTAMSDALNEYLS